MFWWWGPGWGWVAGLISAALWIGIIVGAIVLLRRELPDLQHRYNRPPALRLLEERYARGEITREDFLHRREVLLSPHASAYPPSPETRSSPEASPSPSPPPPVPASVAPPPSPEAEPPPPAPDAASDRPGGAMSSTYEPPRPPDQRPPDQAQSFPSTGRPD